MRRTLTSGALLLMLGLTACHTGGNYLRENPDLPSNGYPFYALQQSTHSTLYPPHGGAIAATYEKHENGEVTFTPYERYFYIPAHGPNRERHLTGASGVDNLNATVVSRAAAPTYRAGVPSYRSGASATTTATVRAPVVTSQPSTLSARRPPAPRVPAPRVHTGGGTLDITAPVVRTPSVRVPSGTARIGTSGTVTGGTDIRNAQWVERRVDGRNVLVREYDAGSGRAREVGPVNSDRVILPPPRPSDRPPAPVYAR